MLKNNSHLLPLIHPDAPLTCSLAFIPFCYMNPGADIKSQYTSTTCCLIILFTAHTALLFLSAMNQVQIWSKHSEPIAFHHN